MKARFFLNQPNRRDEGVLPPTRAPLAFHRRLPGYQPTPLIDAPELARMLRIGHVLVKNESSRLGLPAFKILGASWAVYRALEKRLGHSRRAVGIDGRTGRTPRATCGRSRSPPRLTAITVAPSRTWLRSSDWKRGSTCLRARPRRGSTVSRAKARKSRSLRAPMTTRSSRQHVMPAHAASSFPTLPGRATKRSRAGSWKAIPPS